MITVIWKHWIDCSSCRWGERGRSSISIPINVGEILFVSQQLQNISTEF